MSALTALALLAFTGGPIALAAGALVDVRRRLPSEGGVRAVWTGVLVVAALSAAFFPSPYIDSAPERRIVADGPDLLSGDPIERETVSQDFDFAGLVRRTRIRVSQRGELLEEQSVDGVRLPLLPLVTAALWFASPTRRRARPV